MLLGIAAVVAVLIAEIVLSATWNRAYFTIGLPIFVRRIDRPQGLDDVSVDELPKAAATVAGAKFVFRRFERGVIAFREKPFTGTMHYAPLMRGLIRHKDGEAAVMVSGLINWTAVAAIAFFAIALGRRITDILPYLLATLGILYLIQFVRFGRVARALRPANP